MWENVNTKFPGWMWTWTYYKKARGVGVWCWFVLKGNQMQITAVLWVLVTSFLFIKKLETCCRRQGTKWGQGCLAACYRGGMFTTTLTRGSCLLFRVFVRLPVFVSDGTVCERVLSWVFLKTEMGRRERAWVNKRLPPLLCSNCVLTRGAGEGKLQRK